LNWWAEQPRRAHDEQKAIATLAQRSPWLANVEMRTAENLRLAFDFDIVIVERTIPLTLVYPDFFPDTAASVFARDRELISGHQYGPDGELCLEHRPDNWSSDVTGAMMIESAHRLLSSEQESGLSAPSEHRITRAQRMRLSQFRLLYTADTLTGLSTVAEGQAVEAEIDERDTAGTHVAQLIRVGPADAPLWLEGRKRGGSSRGIRTIVARIAKGSGRICGSFGDLKALLWSLALPQIAMDLADKADPTALLLFDGIRLHVILVATEPGGRGVVHYDPVYAEKDQVRLDPEYERLKGAKVAIVGCGSVGSKVAAQLARSGVANFVLVDGDVLASGNLVRNELDLRSVGVHKSVALGTRLCEINPDCAVTAWTNPIGGQQSGAMAAATIDSIEECDLVVDATAEPTVFNLCAAIARRAEIPMCWASVFGGGVGGIVMRLRPGVEPPPLVARQRIEAWYREQGVDWPDDGSSQPYAEAGSGPPLIADDADVTTVASHLSRFAIDTLARPDVSIFPYSAYVIGLRERWLFTAPFDVRPIDLGEGNAWGVEKETADADALQALLADLTPRAADAG